MRIHPAPLRRAPDPVRAAPAPRTGAPPSLGNEPDRAAPGPWHTAFIVVGIILYTGARLALSAANVDDADPGGFNPFNTLLQAVILLGALSYGALHPRAAAERLVALLPFLLLVGLCMASSLWSQSFQHSFRRSVSMLTLLLFVVYVDAVLDPHRFMRLVVRTILGLCAASILEAVLRPAVGFDVGEYANAVRGVFTQKNGFGAALMAGALALSFVVMHRGRIIWRDLAVLGVLLVMLVLSRSTTSLVLTLLIAASTVGALGLLRGGVRLAGTVIAAGSATLAAWLLLTLPGSFLFDLLGKEESLTGRVYIWEGVRWAIAQRPWLGHGFSAFWLPNTNGAEAVWQIMFWQVPSAHSGYLETVVELGYAGAVLTGAVALLTLLRALAALRDARRPRAVWSLLFLTVLALYNYSESALLEPWLGFLYWVFTGLLLARRQSHPAWRLRPPPPPVLRAGTADGITSSTPVPP